MLVQHELKSYDPEIKLYISRKVMKLAKKEHEYKCESARQEYSVKMKTNNEKILCHDPWPYM